MTTIDKILTQYDDCKDNLDRLKIKIETLVKELITDRQIIVHNVSARTKDRDSLEKKVRKKAKYDDIIQITDLLGVRIITLFEDEVDAVAELINDEFDVDKENSIDKRIKNYDQFGYASLNYVVCLKEPRSNLAEYKDYKGIKLEIQIRSILQHSWAEIEHDIGYKSKEEVPHVAKRNFARIAALLEKADVEFIRLRDQLSVYVATIEQEVIDNPESVELNGESLKVFAQKIPIIKELDTQITKSVHSTLIKDSEIDTSDVPKLNFLGINNIKQLRDALESRKVEIVKFATEFMSDHGHKNASAPNGISLTYLCYLMIAERKNETQLTEFLRLYYRESWFKHLFNRIQDSYNNINGG